MTGIPTTSSTPTTPTIVRPMAGSPASPGPTGPRCMRCWSCSRHRDRARPCALVLVLQVRAGFFRTPPKTLMEGLMIPLSEWRHALYIFTGGPTISTPRQLAERIGWDDRTARRVTYSAAAGSQRAKSTPPRTGGVGLDRAGSPQGSWLLRALPGARGRRTLLEKGSRPALHTHSTRRPHSNVRG